MPKFRKKPVVIEARRFDPAFGPVEVAELASWCGGDWRMVRESPTALAGRVVIETLEGEMEASPGDWIIRGVKGEFYPIKDEILRATYEPADEEAARSWAS